MPETTETLSLGIKSQPMVDGFRKAGAASRKFSEKFTRQMKSVTRSARKTGLILSASLTAPIVLMGRSAVKAFFAQEDAIESLRSALGGAGTEVNLLTKDFAVYAAGIQKVTIYGDELLISQAAYMKNLGVEASLLKDATKAAVGLAARYRIDLQTAAMLVGRASKGQTQMLTRYGIVMAETLSPQEKFNELLKIGAANFRLAEDAAKTTSGQLIQAANAFGDMKEAVGAMVVEGLNFNEVAAKIVEVSQDMKAWFEQLTPAGKAFLSTILLITAALGPLALAISAVTFTLAKLSLAYTYLTSITWAHTAAVHAGKFAQMAFSVALIVSTGLLHGNGVATTLAAARAYLLTSATWTTVVAFAALAVQITLIMAAFVAGYWIGKQIRKLWSDDAKWEKMAKAISKVTAETKKMNEEMAKVGTLTDVGFKGQSVLSAWQRQAEIAKGTAKELVTVFNIGMRNLTKTSLSNIGRLNNAMGERGTEELLKLRMVVRMQEKMNATLGLKESRENIVSRLQLQTKTMQNLRDSMNPSGFTNQLFGDIDQAVRAAEALSGGAKDGVGGPASSALSSEKASLAVAGSIEAYRAETRKSGRDKTQTAVIDTEKNTSKMVRILEAGMARRPNTFNSVVGLA